MKKLLFFILVTLFQISVNAETYNVVIDGIKYELTYINKGGSVYTNAEVKSNSYSGDIIIPVSVTYNGTEYNVTSIGDAFSGCSGLTSIIIPESVTGIGDYAFQGCSSLTSVIIPESVTSIGEFAFSGCSGLTSITIPNSVTSISYQTFCDCSALTSVTIPNSVTFIGGKAFYCCSSLTSITIGNGVTFIGGNAFSGCSKLKTIHICDLSSWCKISLYEYEGHFQYSYCDLPEGYRIYINNEEVKDLVVPNSVTSIKRYAFSGCSLTSVTIPNSVTSIEDDAFSGCSLTSVSIPNSVTSIGSYVFSSCINLASVIIPNSVTSIGNSAFENCTGLASVTIPNSVTSIEYGAFKNCSGLTSVTIPNSVTGIGSKAFYGCIGLKQASIGSGSIGENSFENCNSLVSLTIGNGVKSIGLSAFRSCSSLTSVFMGTGIKNIDGSAFASCPELADVYCYAENVPSTSSNAFIDSYIEYATLHVPDISIDIYKQTSPWKSFKEIVPLTVKTYILTYMVDDEVYKTYEVDYGTAITPEPEPTKDGYTFSGWSEIPETMPAHDVTVTGSFIPNETREQCGIPSIAFVEGKLFFDCETEDAEFHYEIKVEDAKEGVGFEVTLSSVYEISVYASKEGYNDSEKNTATLYWINVDPNSTGVIENEMRVNTNAILVQNNGGAIAISGLTDGENVLIYNISGQLIAQGKASGSHVEIGTNLSSGDICIIKITDKSVKYLLK